MNDEEIRERKIQGIADLLRTHPFTIEFKAKKNPKGIRVIFEITQGQMQEIAKKTLEKMEGRQHENQE